MNERLLGEVKNKIITGSVCTNEIMANHTTFRIGGPADIFVVPGSMQEAEDIIRLLCVYKEPFHVIGNGSNLLVSDKGIRGVVVCLSKGTDDIKVEGNAIIAGAGALLSKIAVAARDNSLTGLEFASGIPGSLGGGLVMNAGAYGGELSQVITEVTMIDTETGEAVTFANADMAFSYRHSIVKEHPYIVLSAKMVLEKGNKDIIKQTMDELSIKRREKQPLEYPSAGSTFKRPEGYFAGKLIQDAGLKGYKVGGAQVSEKHSGFVINIEDATAADVLTLIKDVRDKVENEFGVVMEPEVCMLGEDMSV